MGCVWLYVVWVWGRRMGKYSRRTRSINCLLPWSSSDRLLPISWSLPFEKTTGDSFSGRHISFQGMWSVKDKDLRIIVNHILFSSGTTLTYLFQVPGLGGVLSAFCCTPGTITSCADDLKAGNLLGLAPGGVYEAQFSDNHYKLEWKRYIFVFHYNIKNIIKKM